MLRQSEIRTILRDCGLSGRAVCVHSSFRSFGAVQGGPMGVVHAFLDEGCTVILPSFSWSFLVPAERDYLQNGVYAQRPIRPDWQVMTGYCPECCILDERRMGAIPTAVVNTPGRIRSCHPLCSFVALGPFADELLRDQQYLDVYAPFDRLGEIGGFVIMMGVHYDKCTLLHNAEKAVGVKLTRRWAKVGNHVVETENGSCSSGFTKLEEVLAPIANCGWVGNSYWRILPVRETMALASDAMTHNINIRHCGYLDCPNCNDITNGGVVLDC